MNIFNITDIFNLFSRAGVRVKSYNPKFWFNNMGQINSPTPSTTKTNTRTSTATAFDHEGVLVTGEAGEIMLDGGRREQNLAVPSSTLDAAAWVKAKVDVTPDYLGLGTRVKWDGTGSINDASIGNNCESLTGTGGRSFAVCMRIRSTSGAQEVNLKNTQSAVLDNFSGAISVTEAFQTISFTVTNGAAAGNGFQTAGIRPENGSATFDVIIEWAYMAEVTGRTNQAPPEYIDSEVDHGYGVNGVKWYSTTNGNSVASNIVTEAPGTAITPVPQVLMQPMRTNYAWPNQDLTHANWVKTNITAALDATDLSGVANAASTLTATTANGTVFNTITLASAENTTAFYVRRKTGTGTIEISDDGGTSYTDITSSINSSTYTQATVTTTQANPSIGLRIVTSSDAVEVVSQLETGSTATTLIETATAAATRDNDEGVISDFNNWAPTTSGIMLFAFTPSGDWAALGAEQLVYGGASANLLFRSTNDDGLKATDGTSTPSILSGHTPGTEIIASVYWDASINIFQIGYYEMDNTTQHWDASPATFTTLTVDPELIMTKIIDGAVTIRGLQIFNGMPASGVDGASIEAWIEANQEAKINERQA